ncbi:HNH endonuclease [Vibrio cholerae]
MNFETMTTTELETLVAELMDAGLFDDERIDIILDILDERAEGEEEEGTDCMEEFTEEADAVAVAPCTESLYDSSTYDYDSKLESIEDSLKAKYTAYTTYTHKTGTELLVSELGDIWNLKTLKKLTPSKSSSGYYTVSVGGYGELVHRIIADAFVPNPDNLTDVDHIHPDKSNNAAFNLQWMTRSENSRKGKKIYYKGFNSNSGDKDSSIEATIERQVLESYEASMRDIELFGLSEEVDQSIQPF